MAVRSGCSAVFIKTCVPKIMSMSSWLWCVIYVVCWCVLHWLLALYLVSSETPMCAGLEYNLKLFFVCELNSPSPLRDGLAPWCYPHVPLVRPPALSHPGSLYQTMLYHIQICLGLESPVLWLCLPKGWAERNDHIFQHLLCGCWCSLMWGILCQRAAD